MKYIIIFMLLLGSCKDKSTKFHYLEHYKKEASGIGYVFMRDTLYFGTKLYETVLIENCPKDLDSLKTIMLNYFDTLNIKVNKTKYFALRGMIFYEYNDKTDNFLYSTKDPNRLANFYIYDYASPIGYINIERCSKDSLKFVKIIEVQQIDTLYNCESLK